MCYTLTLLMSHVQHSGEYEMHGILPYLSGSMFSKVAHQQAANTETSTLSIVSYK